jgi:hypothetical protein
MPPPPRPPAGRPGPPGGTPPFGRPGAARPGAPYPGAATPGAPSPNGRPGAAGRPAAAVRPGTPAQAARAAEEESLEPRFDRIERRIQQLKVQYNRFFAGDLPQPPTALLDEIEAEMRRLRSINMRRSVDAFRFSGLETQLHSYSEMYGRRVRATEEGKVAPRRQSHPAMKPIHDADAGIVVTPRLESDAVEALFAGLVQKNGKTPTMDLDTFRNYLQRQVAQIRDKTGCDAVQFRVATEEGKVKLKAKPVGAAGA